MLKAATEAREADAAKLALSFLSMLETTQGKTLADRLDSYRAAAIAIAPSPPPPPPLV